MAKYEVVIRFEARDSDAEAVRDAARDVFDEAVRRLGRRARGMRYLVRLQETARRRAPARGRGAK